MTVSSVAVDAGAVLGAASGPTGAERRAADAAVHSERRAVGGDHLRQRVKL